MERTPDRVGVLVSRDLSRCLASAHVCLVPRIAFWCRAAFFQCTFVGFCQLISLAMSAVFVVVLVCSFLAPWLRVR